MEACRQIPEAAGYPPERILQLSSFFPVSFCIGRKIITTQRQKEGTEKTQEKKAEEKKTEEKKTEEKKIKREKRKGNGKMITSAANQRVKQIVLWQKKSQERHKDGVFVAEGLKMFEEAPGGQILEVYLSESLQEKIRLQGNGLPVEDKLKKTGFELVSDEVFRKMSDTQTPQGILTVLRQPRYQLSDLLRKPDPLLLVLENIQDPGNLGTILRTGEGAGITGVILSEDTVDIYNPKTVRSTMGSIYRVPFLYVADLEATLGQLHQAGVATYAAHLNGKNYYGSFSFRHATAFLVGNEAKGLRESTAKLARHSLRIPMEGKVESLNAAIASALLMYEAHRQRHMEP